MNSDPWNIFNTESSYSFRKKSEQSKIMTEEEKERKILECLENFPIKTLEKFLRNKKLQKINK